MNGDPSEPKESTRPPTLEDLLLICRSMNHESARYILIGGVAILEHGLARMTEDIDFLIDPSPDNVARVKKALTCLPDQASNELADRDIAEFLVVRINDEITVDLMAEACGIGYDEASSMMEWRTIRDVKVPIATPQLLWKTKQTHREKDALDRSYLRKWFSDHDMDPPSL